MLVNLILTKIPMTYILLLCYFTDQETEVREIQEFAEDHTDVTGLTYEPHILIQECIYLNLDARLLLQEKRISVAGFSKNWGSSFEFIPKMTSIVFSPPSLQGWDSVRASAVWYYFIN